MEALLDATTIRRWKNNRAPSEKLRDDEVWPIITLGALIWGSTLADPHSVGREGKPHPRHHLSEFDPDDFIAPNMPHRPVTMAFREVFQKLLNEETDWSAPDGKKAVAVLTAMATTAKTPARSCSGPQTIPTLPACRSPAGAIPTRSLCLIQLCRPLVRPADRNCSSPSSKVRRRRKRTRISLSRRRRTRYLAIYYLARSRRSTIWSSRPAPVGLHRRHRAL